MSLHRRRRCVTPAGEAALDDARNLFRDRARIAAETLGTAKE
jgi:hypothetical protein